ncbi:hypothetical protein HHUSO_G36002 [Huso huso]|uniref:Uncharacterized protein n=1 Tax=Huso huso TaxID=61971 RepID=A0ABR0Y280_HUSHU
MELKNRSGRKRKRRESHDEGERTNVLKTEKNPTPLLSARAIGAKKQEPCSEVNPDGKPGKKAKMKKEEEEASSHKPCKRKARFEDDSSETKLPKMESQEGEAKGPRSRDRAKGRRPNGTQSVSFIGRQTAGASVQVFQNHGGKDMEESPVGPQELDVILKQDSSVVTYSKVLKDPRLTLGLRAQQDLAPNNGDQPGTSQPQEPDPTGGPSRRDVPPPRRGPGTRGTQG